MKMILFVFGFLPLAWIVATRNFDLMIPSTIITLVLTSMEKSISA